MRTPLYVPCNRRTLNATSYTHHDDEKIVSVIGGDSIGYIRKLVISSAAQSKNIGNDVVG